MTIENQLKLRMLQKSRTPDLHDLKALLALEKESQRLMAIYGIKPQAQPLTESEAVSWTTRAS